MHPHAQNLVMVRPRGGRGFESQQQAQEKTFCFRANALNDVIWTRSPYPASQHTVASATPLRILP